MPQLKEITAARWAAHGELAFLLEGDLKEAAGGLRDVDHPARHRPGRRRRHACARRSAPRNLRLLDTRDALHLAVGRRVDRLVAQERAAVAELLDLDDGDALLRRVAGDARTVAHALDDAWRAADRLRSGRRRGTPAGAPVRRPVARDVVEQDGELVLARTAIGPVPDPSLSLRVAAAAATDATADRPRDQRMAGGLLPAAADAVAAGRPRRAGLAAGLRRRACCPPGRPATGTA